MTGLLDEWLVGYEFRKHKILIECTIIIKKCIFKITNVFLYCLDPTDLASLVNKIGRLGGARPSLPILFTNGINPLGSLFYFETISNY